MPRLLQPSTPKFSARAFLGANRAMSFLNFLIVCMRPLRSRQMTRSEITSDDLLGVAGQTNCDSFASNAPISSPGAKQTFRQVGRSKIATRLSVVPAGDIPLLIFAARYRPDELDSI